MRGAAVLALAALAGCAGPQWQKPGGTAQQFSADKAGCDAQALARFPVHQPVRMVPGYYMRSQQFCTEVEGETACHQTGTLYQPPVQQVVDANEAACGQASDACLQARAGSRCRQKADAFLRIFGGAYIAS